MEDLKVQLAPEGTLEEMLVEKIAAVYWRLRRAYRYEVGLIRQELDTATDDFYSGEASLSGYKKHKTDEEIEREMKQEKEHLQEWEKDKKDLSRMYKAGKSLEEIYDWGENWEQLYYKVSELVPDEELDNDEEWTKQLREFLNNKANWSDDRIWQTIIEVCDERIGHHKEQILALRESCR